MPTVILRVEKEVGRHDGNADGHNDKDDVHQQHEAVHIIILVEGGEDEIHLNEDTAEWQYASQYNVHPWLKIPPLLLDLSWDLLKR